MDFTPYCVTQKSKYSILVFLKKGFKYYISVLSPSVYLENILIAVHNLYSILLLIPKGNIYM